MAYKRDYLDPLIFMTMASFWALNYSVLKLALNFEPPFVTLFFRVLFALITSLIFALPYSSSLKYISFLDTFVLGFFNIFLFMGLWFLGEQVEPASISSILVYTYPIISVLLSIVFLNEKLNLSRIFGLLFGFSGIVLIASRNLRTGGLLGIFLLLAAALSWSIGTTYFKKRLDKVNVHTVNFLQYAFALPLVGIISLTETFKPLQWPFVFYTFYMGFFGTSIAYLIYLYLVSKHGIVKTNPYLFMVPVLGTIFSLLINHEGLSAFTIGGLILVGVGVYLSFSDR